MNERADGSVQASRRLLSGGAGDNYFSGGCRACIIALTLVAPTWGTGRQDDRGANRPFLGSRHSHVQVAHPAHPTPPWPSTFKLKSLILYYQGSRNMYLSTAGYSAYHVRYECRPAKLPLKRAAKRQIAIHSTARPSCSTYDYSALCRYPVHGLDNHAPHQAPQTPVPDRKSVV